MADQDIDIRVIVRDEFSKQLNQLNSKMNKSRANWREIGRAAKIGAVAMVAATAISVNAASNLQSELSTVATMLDEQSSKHLPSYADGLKKMAVEYGEATATLSDGLYDILSASVPAAKALDVLAVSATAAKAGITSTGIAADAITTVLNSYGLSVDKAGDVSDWMFGVVKRGKLTFAELAPNIGKVASVASELGVSLEETGAALATMTRGGLRTEVAVTGLRQVLMSILKPTEEASTAFKDKFNVSLDASLLKSKGLVGILGMMKDAGLSKEEISAMFPEKEVLAVVLKMLGDYEGLLGDTEALTKRAGATQEAYTKKTADFEHKLNQVKEVVKGVQVAYGEQLLPVLGDFFDQLVELMPFLIQSATTMGKWAAAVTEAATAMFKSTAAVYDEVSAIEGENATNAKRSLHMQAVANRLDELTSKGASLSQAYQLLRLEGIKVDGAWVRMDMTANQLRGGAVALEKQLRSTAAAQKAAAETDVPGAPGAPEAGPTVEEEMARKLAALEGKKTLDEAYAQFAKDLEIERAEERAVLADMELAAAEETFRKKIGLSEAEMVAMKKNADFNVKLAKFVADYRSRTAKAEMDMRLATLQTIAANSVAAIQTVVGTEQGAFGKRKGIVLALIAIEKGLAIARLWSAEASKGVVGFATAAAGTALLSAQFAQQTGLVGGTAIDTSALPSAAVGGGGGGAAALTAAGGGAAGRGQQITIDIGGIQIDLHIENLENLDAETAESFLRAAADAMRDDATEAVRFALLSAQVAEQNRELSV